MAALAEAKGAVYMDAPVSGGQANSILSVRQNHLKPADILRIFKMIKKLETFQVVATFINLIMTTLSICINLKKKVLNCRLSESVIKSCPPKNN